MIGFNNIGSMGWLGNQMFQYASLQGIAKNRGFDFCAPPDDGTRAHNYSLFKFFKMSNCKNIQYINEETYCVSSIYGGNTCGFEFSEELFNNCPDNVNINAFLQSDKYFSHVRNDILEDFSFKKEFEKPFDKYISLHVRRGDYVHQPQYHPVCSLEYYSEALEIINEDLPLVVFSDDIEWCKQNIKADYYSEESVANRDLYLMTKAEHNIIANSTFSWWGAWLNKSNNKVVAPKQWFGWGYSYQKTDDLYPEGWSVI